VEPISDRGPPGRGDRRFELAARRTGLAFQRTRMSADRTLMSVIRTSLSLIGFGFTISQVFQKLHAAGVLPSAHAPLRFGVSLVGLGIAMLVGGVAYHVSFMVGLRASRRALKRDGLIHAESTYPVSLTLLTAIALIAIGIAAIASMLFAWGPFG
jgi:putative membrane protein